MQKSTRETKAIGSRQPWLVRAAWLSRSLDANSQGPTQPKEEHAWMNA
jgi:hypothetical protein